MKMIKFLECITPFLQGLSSFPNIHHIDLINHIQFEEELVKKFTIGDKQFTEELTKLANLCAFIDETKFSEELSKLTNLRSFNAHLIFIPVKIINVLANLPCLFELKFEIPERLQNSFEPAIRYRIKKKKSLIFSSIALYENFGQLRFSRKEIVELILFYYL